MHSSNRYPPCSPPFAPGYQGRRAVADSGAAVVAAPSVTFISADLTAMEKKFIDLPEIPAMKYGWRPGEGCGRWRGLFHLA